jgi:hypothetical protein
VNATEYLFVQVGANTTGYPAVNTTSALGGIATAATITPWMALQIDPIGYFTSPLNTTGFFNKWFFGVNACGNTATQH